MLRAIFDMETQDPDDFLTLLLLLGHPEVDLRAVTITPGSAWQVGLVRRTLQWFGADIPVGAHNIDHPKTCVSPWHERAYGTITPSLNARPGGEVLVEVCDLETTLITGAALHNLNSAMEHDDFILGRLVAQGGFAGEGVVPEEKQLEKFRGRRTCPTFNLNGNPSAALRALKHPAIGDKRFVSKNVCHGVVYEQNMHDQIASVKHEALYLQKIWQGMNAYLSKKQRHASSNSSKIKGKKMHDPLAACCAINEAIGEWAEVDLYRERGEWGAMLSPGSDTRIIIDYDHQLFLHVLTAGKLTVSSEEE